jgi:hypothetical protein
MNKFNSKWEKLKELIISPANAPQL